MGSPVSVLCSHLFQFSSLWIIDCRTSVSLAGGKRKLYERRLRRRQHTFKPPLVELAQNGKPSDRERERRAHSTIGAQFGLTRCSELNQTNPCLCDPLARSPISNLWQALQGHLHGAPLAPDKRCQKEP